MDTEDPKDIDQEHFIDEPTPLSVGVIGGGMAGVLAGILLPAKVPGIKLTILEKNEDFGGTWLENKYPGVRCDIPGDVYQATFAANAEWKEQFPQGQDVLDYWQGLAKEYDVYKYALFGHKVQQLEWNKQGSFWSAAVLNVRLNQTTSFHFDFVLTAFGRFNDWKIPHFPGMNSFQGRIIHTAAWNPDLDVREKRVALIGNGSSGIQLLPWLQKNALRVDHYARSPTWIAGSWAGDENGVQTRAQEARELSFRKDFTDKYWRRFNTYMKGTEENRKLQDVCRKNMEESAGGDVKLLLPQFPPNCRRLTPGPGYIQALQESNVEYITKEILQLTTDSIRTVDDVERQVDLIICATGFNIDMAPSFPIKAGPADLLTSWTLPNGSIFPHTYMGLATPGFPNLLFIQGPHGTGLSGIVPHSTETQLVYAAKVLRKASREGISSLSPDQKATDEFQEYSSNFFSRTVMSDNCRSWYNGGQPGTRIHGLWPGSSAHLTLARKDPRWEDYEYTYRGSSSNRFDAFLGNGCTRKELDPKSDMTPYLRPLEQTDLKTIHEEWWSYP